MKTAPLLGGLLGLGLLMLTGCGGSDSPVVGTDSGPTPLPSTQLPGTGTGAGFDLARSALARDLAPATSNSELGALVAGNTAFAFNLYQRLAVNEGNLAFSPHSISVALAMVYAGAKGVTGAEIAQALAFNLGEPALHRAFNALDLALASRGANAAGKDGKPFRLRTVNAAWAQRGYPFVPGYLDTLARNYGAGLNVLDFLTTTEPSRRTINAWVADQTEQRIPELLPEGSVTSLTRLVLTNAVYFNAAWASPFKLGSTAPAPFRLLDGSEVRVPTMVQSQDFRYAHVDDITALEMPYDGDEVSIVLMMGGADFKGFEAALAPSSYAKVVAALAPTQVEVHLPKFESRSKAGLVPVLQALGMREAFVAGMADLSGIDGQRELFVSDILHEAFVLLDEAGTEAAAATGVIVGVTSIGPEPVTVRFDRPFVYVIRDVATGAILFIGRVLDPRG
ncbi:MAG: serpin family protein [Thiotrichales bacterium]